MSGKEVAVSPKVDLVRREAIVAKLVQMAETVPGQEGDGLANILEMLLTATSVEQLDQPWNSAGLKNYLDQTIRVDRIQKNVSNIAGGMPFYLLAFGVDLSTGETVTFTSSAQAVIVQLLLMHQNNWFPAIVIPREATEPTEDGFYPQHLEIARAKPTAADRQRRMREAVAKVAAEREARAPGAEDQDSDTDSRPRFRTRAAEQTEPAF